MAQLIIFTNSVNYYTVLKLVHYALFLQLSIEAVLDLFMIIGESFQVHVKANVYVWWFLRYW